MCVLYVTGVGMVVHIPGLDCEGQWMAVESFLLPALSRIAGVEIKSSGWHSGELYQRESLAHLSLHLPLSLALPW